MAIIPRTETQELSSLADIPIGELAKHCHDPAMLGTVISMAYNLGYKLGQEQAHNQYNVMFKGQHEIELRN